MNFRSDKKIVVGYLYKIDQFASMFKQDHLQTWIYFGNAKDFARKHNVKQLHCLLVQTGVDQHGGLNYVCALVIELNELYCFPDHYLLAL